MSSRKVVEYQDAEGNVFEGVLCHPSNAKDSLLPTVIIFPAFQGVSEFDISKAEKLANNHGYIAFVADIYGKGIRPAEIEIAITVLRPLVENRILNLKPRLEAALNFVKKLSAVDQNKICAMGYCIGGLCVLDMARHNFGLRAVVSFHGTLKPVPDLALDEIKNTSVHVHHGDADFHIDKEQIDTFHEEMRTRNADFVFVSHAKAEHAFTEPGANSLNRPGVGYNEKADKRSWRAAIAAFEEAFDF